MMGERERERERESRREDRREAHRGERGDRQTTMMGERERE